MIFRIPGCQVGVTWCFFGIQGDQVTILGKKCRFICKIKKKVLSLRGFSGTACRSAGGSPETATVQPAVAAVSAAVQLIVESRKRPSYHYKDKERI